MKYQPHPFIVIILISLLTTTALSQEKIITKPELVFKLFKLRHRPAQEVLPSVQTILSAEGKATADTITNGILIIDRQSNLEQAIRLLKELDISVPQLLIQLRYRSNKPKGKFLSTTTGISAKGISLSTSNIKHDQKLMLRVRSGSRALLRIGKEIPFSTYWISLCRRHGYNFSWLSEYKQIGTSLLVTPVALDNTVDLTLTPKISFTADKAIEFIQTATRITIPYNHWTTISASAPEQNDILALIISENELSPRGQILLQVKATLI